MFPKASLADAAIVPFVRQFAAVDPAWFDAQPLPAVQAWLAAWLDSDLFKACMSKIDAKVLS
jgi:glutathione S-transferase